MNINYENIKAAYYRGQNILKIYSGSTMEWEYETEPMEQTTKQIWYNSVSGDVVEPYASSAMGTVVSNTAYETKCVLEFASDVTAIGANAFSGCTNLEYVSLPVSATSIGDNAFDGCSALDEIYMPSVQRIGRESFKDCAFTAFTVPTSVTAITADAFKGVAIEEFNYVGTKAQWSGITYGDFWDEDTWITNVIHCSDGDIELYQYDYSKRYLEFVATSGGTFQFDSPYGFQSSISYSTDQGKTWSTPASSVTVNVNSGDTVMWKGEIRNNVNFNGIARFTGGTATFDVQGNILSLAYGDNFKNQTVIPSDSYGGYFNDMFIGNKKIINAKDLIIPSSGMGYHTFYRTFKGCSNLITAPSVLPATTLSMYSYQEMFEDCTSLTQPPIICATTFNGGAPCNHMFQGCTSLTTAPQLLATTLVESCYEGMFQGCTSLTQAPTLPATTLADKCYSDMFKGCTSLTTAPSLLASTIPTSAYTSMFSGCTSLTTAPSLPATTLAKSCYESMFQDCTALTAAPSLNATTLAQRCYSNMFMGCTSLTAATQLPATTLANECYCLMFMNCTSLTTAPQLPATTLTEGCYDAMFRGCSSLSTAPSVLPATTLVNNCYKGMFNGCSNLNYIKMLATDISAYNCLNQWVGNVANSGTFVKSVDMTTLPSGVDGIPNGWTVQDFPPNHLRFVAKSGGTFNFSGTTTANTISYSTDSGDTWSTPAQVVSVNVNSGDTILWKGNMTPTNNGIGTYSASTASFDAQGNIMSLLYGDGFKNQTSLSDKNYVFRGLFQSTKAINAANLTLPETLSNGCYFSMFAGCTSLTQTPQLNASALTNDCYGYMFSGCTSLATAPVLSATTLSNGCYFNMFKDCTTLTQAPQLLATTLAQNCYNRMFYGCTSLTTAPSLPATTLANNCYEYMFRECTSLTTAPDLLATTLTQNCYNTMFYGCSSLNYIKMLATDISASSCLSNWVDGVANSGTFVKAASMTTLPTGVNGIPSGWTVEDFTPPHDYSQDYFTIVAKEDGDIQCGGGQYYDQVEDVMGWCEIEYSTDNGQTWTVAPYEEDDGPSRITFNVQSGDTIMLKFDATNLYDNPDIEWYSDMPCLFNNGYGSAQFEVQGNIMSLIYGDDFTGNTSLDYNEREIKFGFMFSDNEMLVSAENLILPTTTLVAECYMSMFQGCSSLTTAPQLPATTLAESCYNGMFNGCTSLTTAPSLLATTLADSCYGGMFQGCESLTTAPELPATTLAEYCYNGMFQYCTNLNYIKMLATDISANYCLENWVEDVAATGTFVKNANATIPTGDSGIPSGWTVENEGEEEQSFPVSGFNFNYNFKNYDSATHTVPNESGASWNQDLVLQGTPVVDTDHITVTDSDAYAQFPFASNDANIFNLNNTDKREMTVIFKVGNISGADSTPNNLINNRGRYSTGGNDNMNWMVRPKQTICALHDSSSEKASVSYSTKPNIFVMTVSNGTVNNKSITDNVTQTGSVSFTAMSGRICFFCANLQSTATDYITSTERFSGVCYWMFQANRVLTDAEITQVINYNENL